MVYGIPIKSDVKICSPLGESIKISDLENSVVNETNNPNNSAKPNPEDTSKVAEAACCKIM